MTSSSERHPLQTAQQNPDGKPQLTANFPFSEPSLRERVRQVTKQVESEIIIETLERYRWNRRRTAEALKISYRSLMYKMKNGNLRGEAGRWRSEERCEG